MQFNFLRAKIVQTECKGSKHSLSSFAEVQPIFTFQVKSNTFLAFLIEGDVKKQYLCTPCDNTVACQCEVTVSIMKGKMLLCVAIAFTLSFFVACESDNEVFNSKPLAGTWQRVWGQGVMDAGLVRYTFRPTSTTEGTLEIFSSDVFAGDTTIYRNYIVGYTGHIQIYSGPRSRPFLLNDGEEYDIKRLTKREMVWNLTDSSERYARFKKVSE